MKSFNRRDFLKLAGAGTVMGAAGAISSYWYATELEPGWIDVTTLRVPMAGLAPAFVGLRLLQMSDIHLGGWMNRDRLDKAVALARSLNPDVVALTGDFVSGHGWQAKHTKALADLADGLRPLADDCLVTAVLGNHDHWTRASAVRAMLREAGIIELRNGVHTLRSGAASLHLAGVDDYWEGFARLDRVLAQLPEEGAAVLLCHEPDFADISAASGRFGLQISGHSHGGQVVLPFFGPPVLPTYGEKYHTGLYRVKEMLQYTNRGIGMAGLAVRFNCRPEITLFELE
jgi:uncharacterized protein